MKNFLFLSSVSIAILSVFSGVLVRGAEEESKVAELWAHPDFRDPVIGDKPEEGIKKLNELQDRTYKCTSMLVGGDGGCGVIEDITTAEQFAR